ncbi:hypothetical protein GH714_006268 [Hevea brasiliensis]|uniref:Bet v I/Major latex protein domain-containing protein n=1 Tax=Hevea brasiliensis TaxID=3981 RepID=A0A6A6LVP7_HEVBR|nr:hypothetical protein GH714_006268 [Hevea brasiliensis]
MALVGKLETEIEVKSSAEKFSAHTEQKHILSPKLIMRIYMALRSMKVICTPQAQSSRNFNLDGKVHTVKGRIHVDEEKKSVTSVTVEGEILKNYKSVNVTIQVIPKGEGSLVKWIWEYEKVSLDIPDPKKFQDLAINVTKDVDAYATSA